MAEQGHEHDGEVGDLIPMECKAAFKRSFEIFVVRSYLKSVNDWLYFTPIYLLPQAKISTR